MVSEEIPDEMSLARERADVKETKVDSGVVVFDSSVSRPS